MRLTASESEISQHDAGIGAGCFNQNVLGLWKSLKTVRRMHEMAYLQIYDETA